MGNGEYSKRSRRITEPVLKVPPDVDLARAPRMNTNVLEDVQQVTKRTVQELDKDRFILRKTTGWLMATLVITALGGASYLGSKFFTREAQMDHMQEQFRQMKHELDRSRMHRQSLEKRIVELETELEFKEENP